MVIFFIIIGIIMLGIGFTLGSNNSPLSKFAGFVRVTGILIIAIGLSSSMFKQIDAGKVGVKSLYGRVQQDILESGLHIINPLLEVTEFDTQTHNYNM